MEKIFRIALGAVVMGTSLTLATIYSNHQAKGRSERYQHCLKTGKTPIKCSFEVAFT